MGGLNDRRALNSLLVKPDGCASSNDLRQIGVLCNGVSGPSWVEVNLRFGDAPRGAA
jgi:hypothetical protein